MPFIFFDTETTGAGAEDRICQIALGVMKKEGGDYFIDYCKPPLPISFSAMSVHGITEEDVADKPPFAQTRAAEKLILLNNEQSVLIAHNAPFDVTMAKKEGIEWRGHIIDTLRCAKHLISSDSYALQYLRYFLGIYKHERDDEYETLKRDYGEMMNPHNALFDIFILKKLFLYLINECGDYKTLIELSSKPIVSDVLKFGKYKGEKIADIAKKDRRYLEWLIDAKKEDTDIVASVSRYL